jgi:hypothetical protein
MRFTPGTDGPELEKTGFPDGMPVLDLAALPLAALPVAVVLAAAGHAADIRGLQALVDFEGGDAVSVLQRVLYKFGIHTDFCDRSKLKVMDTGLLHEPMGPVKVPHRWVALFVAPLAFKLGPLSLETTEDFFGTFGPWCTAAGLKLHPD